MNAPHNTGYKWLLEQVQEGRDRSECWLDRPWKTVRGSGAGYPVCSDRLGFVRKASHIVLELDGRPRPGKLHALHSCDNTLCVNPGHLRWGTHSENMKDMSVRGRVVSVVPKGQEHHSSLLTDQSVRDIRSRAAGGERQVDLAKEFGIAPQTVNNIVKRRRWSHIE